MEKRKTSHVGAVLKQILKDDDISIVYELPKDSITKDVVFEVSCAFERKYFKEIRQGSLESAVIAYDFQKKLGIKFDEEFTSTLEKSLEEGINSRLGRIKSGALADAYYLLGKNEQGISLSKTKLLAAFNEGVKNAAEYIKNGEFSYYKNLVDVCKKLEISPKKYEWRLKKAAKEGRELCSTKILEDCSMSYLSKLGFGVKSGAIKESYINNLLVEIAEKMIEDESYSDKVIKQSRRGLVPYINNIFEILKTANLPKHLIFLIGYNFSKKN